MSFPRMILYGNIPSWGNTRGTVVVVLRFLVIEGIVQKRQGTIHVKTRTIERLMAEGLKCPGSHDFG